MSQKRGPLGRRDVIKNQLFVAGGLFLGAPLVSNPVSGEEDENLDVRATINRNQEGVVPVEITSRDPSKTIEELLRELDVEPEDLRFGPYDSGMPKNGNPPRSHKYDPQGEVLRVRFESGAETHRSWWDDCEYKNRKAAVISAGDKPRAYGISEVRIEGEPPKCD